MIFQLNDQIVEKRHNLEGHPDQEIRIRAHCTVAGVKYAPSVVKTQALSEYTDILNASLAAVSRNDVASESAGAFACGYLYSMMGNKVCPYGRDAKEKPAWLAGYAAFQPKD